MNPVIVNNKLGLVKCMEEQGIGRTFRWHEN